MPPPKGSWNPIEGPGDYTTTKTVHNDTYPAIDPTKADLSGKAVFVSGASRGLGRAMAISFAQAGASFIAIGARSSLEATRDAVMAAAAKASRKEPKVLCLSLDITDETSVQTATSQIDAEFGKLDVVINNAAIMAPHQTIAESSAESWWQGFNVNLKGPYLTMKACHPLLLKGELKTLVTVASVGAWCVLPTLSSYQTSKLAVVRLTDFFAAENADKGFIAFSIHPGNILTDMVGDTSKMDEKLVAVFTESAELSADSLVYLTGTRREWLSGRYINCTWDLPELEAKKQEIVDRDLLKVSLALPTPV